MTEFNVEKMQAPNDEFDRAKLFQELLLRGRIER